MKRKPAKPKLIPWINAHPQRDALLHAVSLFPELHAWIRAEAEKLPRRYGAIEIEEIVNQAVKRETDRMRTE